MCSIFGFVARENARPNVSTLRDIVTANIRRGPHAFGFAWLDRRGRLRSYRQQGRLTDYTPLLGWLADARLLVGHLRWATQGDPEANINNHPHPCDGGWLVHNGMVHNYRDLAGRRDVYLSSECDSEAISQLVEASPAPSLQSRVVAAVRKIDGPLALLGIWSRPGTVVAVRRGNPLHYASTDEGLYLATLAEGLPDDAKSMADDTVSRIDVRSGAIKVRSESLPATRGTWRRAGGLFAGAYRGG